MLKKYLLSLPARSLSKNELFHSYFSRILNSSGVNAETKRKVDINCENSAQISIAAKNMVTQDDPELWLWDTNKLYAILLFHFFIIMFKRNLFFLKLPFLIVLIVYDLRCAQNQCINVQNRLYQLMQFSKELVFFRTPLSYCLFIMFINFYFCCDIVFF